jgi:uncharacterized membrane protein YqgA involved in biofilm formation
MKSNNGDTPMDAQKIKKQVSSGKITNTLDSEKRADLINRMVRSVIGGLIGMALTSLFGVVVFAFVIKAFVSNDEMSYQLLNSAITLVGTTLGGVLGYFLGRNSNENPKD